MICIDFVKTSSSLGGSYQSLAEITGWQLRVTSDARPYIKDTYVTRIRLCVTSPMISAGVWKDFFYLVNNNIYEKYTCI